MHTGVRTKNLEILLKISENPKDPKKKTKKRIKKYV